MLERLTKKVFICGVPYFIDTVGNDIEAENMTTYQIGMALNRLAAYEDSGLSPEEVQEFAKAKADGRLVVLPCKVGDTVYLTTHGWVEETKVRTLFFGHPSYSRGSPDPRYYRIRCENLDMPWDSIGKTVFLTREAAEKALAEVVG